MILSVITVVMVGVIAYFHFVQGLFSATLSAIIAVLSAILAIGYQETIVDNLFKGKMGDDANAVTIVLVFVVSYVILRIIFDKSIPGNVRFPSTLDKIGAAIMGLVAGIFTAGTFAIAVQTLPFGPSIGGYAPYELLGTRSVIIPGSQQMQDSVENDQMKDPTINPAKKNSLLIPVAEAVLGAVNQVSDGGTLAGNVPLDAIHPDYITELFGDRIGIQVGANHTALNVPGEEQAKLSALFSVSALPAVGGELKELRSVAEKPEVIRPTASQVLLIARLGISHDAADDVDKLFRFSPASIHLVANGKDYYPIGLMDQIQSEPVLLLQHPDDYLFLDLSAGDASIDTVFLVDREDLFGDSKPTDSKVADGRFITVKRLARVDLSGATIDTGYTPVVSKVARKPALLSQIQSAPPPSVNVPPAVAPSQEASAQSSSSKRRANHAPAAAPAESQSPSPTPAAAPPAAESTEALVGVPAVNAIVPYKIGVTTSDENAQNLQVAGGTVSLKDSRLAVVNIAPTATLDKLASGDSPLSELFVPDGKKLVQVSGPTASAPPTLSDATGAHFTANGYAGLVDGKLLMHFDADRALGSVSLPPAATSVTYYFIVPVGTHLNSVTIGSQPQGINTTVQ